MECQSCGSNLKQIAVDCYLCKKCGKKHKAGFLHFMNASCSNESGIKPNSNVSEVRMDVNISIKTDLHNELSKQLQNNFFIIRGRIK